MRIATIMAIVAGLCACTAGKAVAVDPANDVHCSVLTFYFHGPAKHEGAPGDQVRATRGLQDRYAAKMRAVPGSGDADPATLPNVIGPILAAVKADPGVMRAKATAGAWRAVDDPAFDGFARSYMRP